MKSLISKAAIAGLYVSLLALTAVGCDTIKSAAPQVAVMASESVMSPEDLAKVKAVCGASQPLLDVLAAPGSKASSTAIYPQAYCQALNAAPSGQVPATSDSNTAKWLAIGIEAAKVAAVVLPLVL